MLVPLKKNLIVLVKDASEEKVTTSGIIVTGAVRKDAPARGEVAAVGSQVTDIKAGDLVLYHQYAVSEVEDGGQKYHILDDQQVIAVISNE